MSEALPLFAEWQSQIADRIARASSAEEAEAELAAWADSVNAGDDEISEAIYQSALMANMGGQLQIRLVEVPEAGVAAAARAVALAGRRGRPRSPYLSLPFSEAIEDFQSRRVVSPSVYDRMTAEARTRAFTARLLATQSLRERAFAQLNAALEQGGTLRDYAADLKTGEAALGVTPSDPGYVETIFRTNIATAYGAGRVQQMGSPEVLAARPYVQIRATVDGRTTSICKYLNGLIFNRQTDPGWSKYAAPNHFNCRTTEVVLPRSRVNPSQVTRSSDVDSRGEPAPGFDGPPRLALSE